MSNVKKGVSPEQLRQAAKDLNLTVAAIAEGTGVDADRKLSHFLV